MSHRKGPTSDANWRVLDTVKKLHDCWPEAKPLIVGRMSPPDDDFDFWSNLGDRFHAGELTYGAKLDVAVRGSVARSSGYTPGRWDERDARQGLGDAQVHVYRAIRSRKGLRFGLGVFRIAGGHPHLAFVDAADLPTGFVDRLAVATDRVGMSEWRTEKGRKGDGRRGGLRVWFRGDLDVSWISPDGGMARVCPRPGSGIYLHSLKDDKWARVTAERKRKLVFERRLPASDVPVADAVAVPADGAPAPAGEVRAAAHRSQVRRLGRFRFGRRS